MDNVKARKLKPWEKHKLRRMKRQKTNSVNYLHARIILLSRGGLNNRQIASGCGCTPTWVREIIHRFNRGGIDAISWYPYYSARDGPRKFFADIVEQICEVALSPPKKLIGMSVWSLEKLREYLIEQKIIPSISLEWLRRGYRSDEVLHIVLDNAGYHLKAEVLSYAAQHRIRFYWRPTNASWLNRIESHFTALRKFALDNTDHRSDEKQQEAIQCYLSWRNRTRDISLEDWKSYRRTQRKVA